MKLNTLKFYFRNRFLYAIIAFMSVYACMLFNDNVYQNYILSYMSIMIFLMIIGYIFTKKLNSSEKLFLKKLNEIFG